jgi:hypothetical protein
MAASARKFMVLILGLCVLVGVMSPMAGAADYFPLQVGNKWVYNPSFGNGNRADTIVAKKTVNGTPSYVWKRTEAPPDNYPDTGGIPDRSSVFLAILPRMSRRSGPPPLNLKTIKVSTRARAASTTRETVIFQYARCLPILMLLSA